LLKKIIFGIVKLYEYVKGKIHHPPKKISRAGRREYKEIPQTCRYFAGSAFKKADLAFHTIAKIEAGSTPNPTIETVAKIAKALEVSVDDLLK